MPRLDFTAREATLHKAIVVSFDLEDFSDFCNHPEPSVATTVPKLIKKMFDLLNGLLDKLGETNPMGLGAIFNQEGSKPNPSLIKFTGDGALMIWVCKEPDVDFGPEFCNQVVLMMREFQQQLAVEMPKCEKLWKVQELPCRVRVSITSGSVYALRPPHSFTSWTDPQDFVGYCINLAVRLQNHCREVGFLMHHSIQPEMPGLVRMVAKGIKGARNETVLAYQTDITNIPQQSISSKFLVKL